MAAKCDINQYIPDEFEWLSRPVGRMVEIDSRGNVLYGYCSGFNIQNGDYLTAGHCLKEKCEIGDKKFIDRCRINFGYQFEYKKDLLGSWPVDGELFEIYRIKDHYSCQAPYSDSFDYAILGLDPRAAKYKSLEIVAEFPKVKQAVAVVGYPHGERKTISRGKFDGFEKYVPNDEFTGKVFYSACTFGGSSGSPVANVKDQTIFAVHIKGIEATQSSHIGISIREIAKSSRIIDSLVKTGFFSDIPSPSIRLTEEVYSPTVTSPTASGGCCG